ncbi:2568_t:CDS:1, partial [Racocetra fulgida]
AFANVLYKNTALSSLDLSNNQLDSKAGKTLAKALDKNKTLKYLGLK